MKIVIVLALVMTLAAGGAAYARWYGGIGIGGTVTTTPGCGAGGASFNSPCNSALFIMGF